MNTTMEMTDSTYGQLLAQSLPRPIHSKSEHDRLTQLLLTLDEREDLSPEEEALAEVLTLLIEDYEEKQYPLPSVSPGESLPSLMEDRGLKHGCKWRMGRPVAAKERRRCGSCEFGFGLAVILRHTQLIAIKNLLMELRQRSLL